MKRKKIEHNFMSDCTHIAGSLKVTHRLKQLNINGCVTAKFDYCPTSKTDYFVCRMTMVQRVLSAHASLHPFLVTHLFACHHGVPVDGAPVIPHFLISTIAQITASLASLVIVIILFYNLQ